MISPHGNDDELSSSLPGMSGVDSPILLQTALLMSGGLGRGRLRVCVDCSCPCEHAYTYLVSLLSLSLCKSVDTSIGFFWLHTPDELLLHCPLLVDMCPTALFGRSPRDCWVGLAGVDTCVCAYVPMRRLQRGVKTNSWTRLTVSLEIFRLRGCVL